MTLKTFIKVKPGILSAKHCQAIGQALWLFLYILDQADWEQGSLEGYTDAEAAQELGMSRITIRRWRMRLVEHNYITCRQTLHSQILYVHNWSDPRQKWGAESPDETRYGAQDIVPAQHPEIQAAAPENDRDHEMLEQFVQITGMLTFPSKSREQDLTRLRAIAKANHGDAVGYCARFFQEWRRRGYAKSNTAWLDWAVAGEIPRQRTRRSARRKEQEDDNTSGTPAYSQADIDLADAIIAACTE
ncbi:MAG: hypothetical protein ACK2T5_14780 [Anaerolineales bacterium]|jgi:hypothetical protein